jgi:glutamate-1-semialdehyde 2,1-aminomutase
VTESVIDRGRVASLFERETKLFEQKTPKSREVYGRAIKTLPMGVASSYQAHSPYPVYYTRGLGSKVYDVDGVERSDFHGALGCMVQGHANPAIVEAVTERVKLGSQFCRPTEDQILVAEHLARSFRLPKWRFVNSGSEATMDAIRIARGFTGRETVLKIQGSFHGHHDYVMVSVIMYDTDLGPRDNYASLAYGAGLPECVVNLTVPVPFNDIDMMRVRVERLIKEGRKPACLIMEPVMMNLGVVLPQPGYLQAVRDLTREYGIVLIFDEVKTGITTAAGGAVEIFGVVPDMVTLAKAIAAGLPAGAIGGTEEIMETVNSGKVYQVGTYNGNPLCMAAARASLEKVMTPSAYERLTYLDRRLTTGIDEITGKYGLPFHTVSIRSKGCVNFTGGKITDYESFLQYQDRDLCNLAAVYALNRGVVICGGREAEWILSVQHTDEDVDRYIGFYDAMLHDLTAA